MILRPGALLARWPRDAHGTQRLVERRQPDGALFLAIDAHPEHGFHIEAPAYGTHVVAPDGATWAAEAPHGCSWRWHELVFSQVLPTIAVLQGLELLHAGAVAVDGQAFGLVASSGVGKSSVVAHLVGRGAGFVTDDVLAIEEVAGRLVAHPGPRLLKVLSHEVDAMPAAARRRLGPPWGVSAGKHGLQPEGERGPLPLAGLVFLARVPEGMGVVIEPASDSVLGLLAGAYAPHVATRRRLKRQFAVCAAAHRDVAMWRLGIPPGCGAADVAEALVRRLAEARPSNT